MDIPVFVISLKSSKERRDHTIAQLNNLNVSFSIMEAFDGNDLSGQEILNNNDYGIYKSGLYSRYLLKGEIGCTLSHLKVYRKIVDEKIALACLLEDDNIYVPEFKELIFKTDLRISSWDILYLGHHTGNLTGKIRVRNRIQLLPSCYWIGEAVTKPFGSYAYLINCEAARKLIQYALPVRMPFDRFLNKSHDLGIRTAVILPPCVIPSPDFKSTINDNPVVIYPQLFWRVSGNILRKAYSFFPVLRRMRKHLW